jgi:hypothetical protein
MCLLYAEDVQIILHTSFWSRSDLLSLLLGD